jgi:hypothetical protein
MHEVVRKPLFYRKKTGLFENTKSDDELIVLKFDAHFCVAYYVTSSFPNNTIILYNVYLSNP